MFHLRNNCRDPGVRPLSRNQLETFPAERRGTEHLERSFVFVFLPQSALARRY